MTYFLCGRCPELRPIFAWAEEQQTAEITNRSFTTAHNSVSPEVTNDLEVFSFNVHVFLNTNLEDDAWNIFDNFGASQNCLEVWRLVNFEAAQKTQAERLDLKDAMLNPGKLKSFHEVAKGFVD